MWFLRYTSNSSLYASSQMAYLDLSIDTLRKLVRSKTIPKVFQKFSDQEKKYVESMYQEFPDDPFVNMSLGFVDWWDHKNEKAAIHFINARNAATSNPQIFKNFEIGINSWFPELTTDSVFLSELGKDLYEPFIYIRKSQNLQRKTIILSSCDQKYFEIFGDNFITAIQRFYHDFHVHLHIMNLETELINRLLSLKIDNLSITTDVQSNNTASPYFASRRYAIATKIFELYKSDLFIVDIDLFPVSNFKYIFTHMQNDDFDICCATRKKTFMPWNKYLAGKVYFKYSSSSSLLLKYMSAYIQKVAQKSHGYDSLWWIDQNALFLAIDYVSKMGNISINSISRYGKLYIGPGEISKAMFALTIRNLASATDQTWTFNSIPTIFFHQNQSNLNKILKRHPLLLENLACHTPSTDEMGIIGWSDYLLASSFEQELTPKLYDLLISHLISRQFLLLAKILILRIINSSTTQKSDAEKYKIPFAEEDLNLNRDSSCGVIVENTCNNSKQGIDEIIEQLVPPLFESKCYRSLLTLDSRYTGHTSVTRNLLFSSRIESLFSRYDLNNAKTSLHEYYLGTIFVIGLPDSGADDVADFLRRNTKYYVPLLDDNTIFLQNCFPDETAMGRVNIYMGNPVSTVEYFDAICILVRREIGEWLEIIKPLIAENPIMYKKKLRINMNDLPNRLEQHYFDYLTAWENTKLKLYSIDLADFHDNPKQLLSNLSSITRHSKKA